MFDIGFPRDWSSLKKLIWLKAINGGGGGAGIWKTVTGTLIHITDALASPMQKCEVSLEPIQDLHGQDAPYPAGGGKNKFRTYAESKEENGVIWTVNTDGTVTVSGTCTGFTSLYIGEANISDISGNITISGLLDVVNIVWDTVTIRDSNNTTLANVTPSTNYDKTVDLSEYPTAYKLVASVKRANNVATSGTIKLQVEIGSSATPWKPYSNICPITGWTGCEVTRTGKNTFDGVFQQGTFANNGSEMPSTTRIRTGFISVVGGQIYTISNFSGGSTTLHEGYVYDKDKNFIAKILGSSMQSFFYTFANNVAFVRISIRNTDNSAITPNVGKLQVELGSTATDYEPYSGTTLSVTFPDGQTVYGGKYEFVSGGLKSKMASVDMGTLTWLFAAPIFYALVSDSNPPTQGTQPGNIISSQYKVVSRSAMTNDGEISLSTNKYVNVIDSRYSSAAEFKTAMSGVQLVYELATPIEIQLTPQEISTLKGENNIWGDGIITAIYKATE